MRQTHILFLLLLCSIPLKQMTAQSNDCGPESSTEIDSFAGTAFFNFGSQVRTKSQTYKSSLAVGQPFLGYIENLENSSALGFYSRFLLPPLPLTVNASQGDLLDRIQVSWEIDALGPAANDGFNIYRDDVFLENVGAGIRNYNDFNVIAGQPYTYTVTGLNSFGEGTVSSALGFQVPNGVVTGWVSTINGSPVTNALVTLTPMQGFSALFGDLDGAFAINEPGQNPFLPEAGEDWTLTCWIKTDTSEPNGSLIRFGPNSLYIRALTSASGDEGVAVSYSGLDTPFLSATFPDSTKNDWHHVALSFDGSGLQGRLYLDGSLAAIAPMNTIPSADTLDLGSLAYSGGWTGRMDELRIYHYRLDELDLMDVMAGTASSQTPFLTHYWKMDEELGQKSYDIMKRHKLYFCGAAFDTDRPPVKTAGKTNEDGFYKIESASYGTGTTFLAKPKKDFYMHRALKFIRNEADYASIPDFPITPKATIEVWVNSAGPDGNQNILSKRWQSNEFRLELNAIGLDNEVQIRLNNQVNVFGTIGTGYQHLAITLDSLSGDVSVYNNGALMNTMTYSGDSGNWSDTTTTWILGAYSDGVSLLDFFGGLIDEVAFYDTTLSAAKILDHYNASRDAQEMGLRVYFPLDEGNGLRISNVGSVFLDGGTTYGTEWSAFAAHQVTQPHEFVPGTRQVTLNPSVTSVDQVDFSDRSTVPVSGYVRYQNTDCFANRVEILVNGDSFSPKIYTDSTGKFLIDFDPGATAILTPNFEDHVFVPAFWELTNVNNPVAGILFNDITKRTLTGQVAGGVCKKSIITDPPGMGQGTYCRVRVSSLDGCLVREILINNQEGTFTFDDMPPIEKLTVAVVEHSDPLIKTAFQVQGGSTVDLSRSDTLINFIYTAPPHVEIVEGLDPWSPTCDVIVLDQFENVVLKIKLYEQYVPTLVDTIGRCYLDTADFHIINGFAEEVVDTTMGNGELVYTFKVGPPNPSPPNLKTLQILGTNLSGIEASKTTQAIITGVLAKENTFTSQLPEIPTLILRDPPGDGSYSFLEKNEKFCQKTQFTNDMSASLSNERLVLGGAATGTIVAPFGVGATFKIEAENSLEVIANVTWQWTSTNTLETCTNISSKMSTSSDELIVGGERGADLYMGTAMNIIYGFADIVTFDTTLCAAMDSVAVLVQPGDFATTFIYSEFFINNTLIPSLEVLLEQATDSVDIARYTESVNRWQAIVENNKLQKENARFIKNISFDAGTEFNFEETSDTTSSETIESLTQYGADLKYTIGLKINGNGYKASINATLATSSGEKDEWGHAKGITTGYVLKDNDPLDAFSFDVGMDSVYKTPVFNLRAGQSSCPWEPGTANRQAPNLQPAPGSQYVASNIPANEPAVFQVLLGNNSATNEDVTYAFTSIAANNPDGASIKLNGSTLNYLQEYIIPFGTSQLVTLTVWRGPIAYDYDSLLVALVSECEYERDLALSIPFESDTQFIKGQYLSVHFIRPCSEVNINEPRQDWVVFPDPLTPGSDDEMQITVSGYDTVVTDFKLIRLQYRPSDGDGAWINIPGIADRYNPNWSGYDTLPEPQPPLLQPNFTQFYWQTSGLSDGPYEIRAVAVCSGDAADKPGYSQIIKGRIDREPPSLVGIPQPSDGVLQVGDEISFTFNQPVNCNKLIQATTMSPNNVGLYDATTNTLIDANISCVDNKIVIYPNFLNVLYENHILRAELHDIEDLTGNLFLGTDWEFYVDRNELAWLTDSVGLTKYADENKTVSAKIHNRGGYPVPFSIQNVPAWVHVTPDAGTLVANEIRDIEFRVDSTVALGWFADSIVLHTETGQNPFFMGGDELLPFGARIICRPPNWVLDPGQFQLTMTMNLRLMIEGSFAADPEDQVAVFIEGQLRGTAKLTYVPAYDFWEAFVTVYGNTADLGKPLVYEMFDASECLHYPGTLPGDFTFESNEVVGTPDIPGIINGDLLIREMPINVGWNWISFNLDFPDSTINKVLENLPHPANDLIKDQTSFSTYTNSTWIGNLNSIANTSLYLYQANEANIIKMVGEPLIPADVPIPIVAGWNWIGYVPNYPLSVDTALASIPAQAGDIIKSQTAFAQYVDNTVGWVGSLSTLKPPHGYLLMTAMAGTITYPVESIFNEDPSPSRGEETMPTLWTVDATQFEHNMTLIGMFQDNNQNATTDQMELGAFVGDELRGVAQAVYIEFLDAYVFFLTSYANTGGEQLHFKLFDPMTSDVQALQEKMIFSPNNHQGSIYIPVPFTLQTTGLAELSNEIGFDMQPNPFRNETVCRIVLPTSQDIYLSFSDMNGKEVSTMHVAAQEGLNTIIWNGRTDSGTLLRSGLYVVRLKTEHGNITRKVIIHR